MTGHQINSLVGDLVAMAQAMERLPQVEAELQQRDHECAKHLDTIDAVRRDLEQSRAYVVSLQAKLHEAEVAKDAAETMFLEADERTSRALDFIKASFGSAGALIQALEPPKPTITEVNAQVDAKLADVISGYPYGKAESAEDPTSAQSVDHMQTANTSAQGQSEPDPIPAAPTPEPLLPSAQTPSVSSSDGATGLSTASSTESWAGPTPTPPAQPYLGQNYFDWPAYVPYSDWIAGGGTHDDYYERRQDNRF